MSGTVGTNSGRRSGSIGTAASGATISASDPAIDTNPDGGVGTQWVNSTSGEFYILTDATTDENVWTNAGSGTGNVEPWNGQGKNYGYIAAGGYPSTFDSYEKYSLTSDGNSADVANVSSEGYSKQGHASFINGYTTGHNVVDKMAFASEGDMSGIGDQFHNRTSHVGADSLNHGYDAMGDDGANVNTIDKLSFSSDGNMTNVGDLPVARHGGAGCGSKTHGYAAGGQISAYQDVIEKYSFSSDGNGADVGNLVLARGRMHCGSQSEIYGYCAGGYTGSSVRPIDKWSFSSDGHATDVGDLIDVPCWTLGGNSSTSHGYVAGGYENLDRIDKWLFSSDSNAVDVGNLHTGRQGPAGFHI